MHWKPIYWSKLHKLTEEAAQTDYAAYYDQLAGWGGTGRFCHREETLYGLARLYSQASDRLHVAWDRIHKFKGNDDQLRRCLQFAVAIGKLHAAVIDALGGDYTSVICHVENGKLNVTGVQWYLGYRTEMHDALPIDAVQAFVDGGPCDNLKLAVEECRNEENVVILNEAYAGII